MNIFQANFFTRLKSWYTLRVDLQHSDLQEQCSKIDDFWQKCPLVNHYLHPVDIDQWPTPWELINENTYCVYARGLGIIYTLLLLGIKDVEFVEAKNDNNEDVVLVLVSNAKYIINYWPNTIVNNCLSDFKITRHLDISTIIKKTGQT